MAWNAGTRPKAPTVKRPAIRRSGPKQLRVRSDSMLTSGPLVEPLPVAFDSQSERFIYWALKKLLGPERPGVWRYQDPVISGIFQLARVDFVVYQESRRLALRVQTERFHYGAGSKKQAYDLNQRLLLEQAGWRVIDLPEERFIHDLTGTAAIVLTKKALRGEEEQSPITAHTSFGRTARVS